MSGREKLFDWCLYLILACISTGCTTVADRHNPATPDIREYMQTYYFVVESSSDWCEQILEGDLALEDGVITVSSENARTALDPGSLRLSQSLRAAETGTIASVAAYIRGSSTQEFPAFGIKKGAVGTTTVRVYKVDPPLIRLAGEYTFDGDQGTTSQPYRFTTTAAGTVPDPPYRESSIDGILKEWAKGVTQFDFPAHTLYWAEAEHIIAAADKISARGSAVEMVRKEIEEGPLPNLDYYKISFSAPLHLVPFAPNSATVLLLSSYDGLPSGADVFQFEKRDTEWKILRHFWKMGVEVH